MFLTWRWSSPSKRYRIPQLEVVTIAEVLQNKFDWKQLALSVQYGFPQIQIKQEPCDALRNS